MDQLAVVEDRIEELAGRVDAAIRAILDRSLESAPGREHPVVRLIHGSIYDYLENGGKRMHGTSVLLAFAAAGGSPIDAILPVAAGFQLYHHHTLVHDDIYDQDSRRRGSPTIHRAFADWFERANGGPRGHAPPGIGIFTSCSGRLGTVAGFIQGKIVHALAFESIAQAPFPASERLAALRALNSHDLGDNASEVIDVVDEGSQVPEPDACLEIARLKTGRLFRVGAETAGRLAGASPGQMSALSDWAGAVSTAYQLQDDLEDLETDSEKGAGRGIGTDLRTCKPTYLLSIALERANAADHRTLCDWIASPTDRADDLERIIAAVRATGAVDACREKVAALVAEGRSVLYSTEPPLDPEALALMARFGEYFVSKRYWKRSLPLPRDPLAAGKRGYA
jgi:geranylgeranyl diphosphate synthase type I